MLNDFGSDDPGECFWRFIVRFVPAVVALATVVYGILFLIGWIIWRTFCA